MTRNRTTSLPSLLLLLILLATALSASARGTDEAHYRVRRGDYLGRIADRLGVTINEIKRANSLSGDVIHPDQSLRISQPFRRKLAADIAWQHPGEQAHGGVLRGFGTENRDRVLMRRTGVDVHYTLGGGVVAPADGVVRYVGKQDGYGIIMILDHGCDYATVLGPFNPGSVTHEIGDVVLCGERLGRTAPPVEGNQPYLHVELRRKNEAIDPARLIR